METNIEDIIALTPVQEGMLFHYLKAPGSEIYVEQLALEISGTLEKETLETAWNVVAQNNEMLRTRYRWEKMTKPVQIILKNHTFNIQYHDLPNEYPGKNREMLEEIKTRDRTKGLDLGREPFRITWCRLEPERYVMIITHHHILYDGWSTGIILKEFFQAHREICRGNAPLLTSGKTKFKEFVKWLGKQDTTAQEMYWKENLQGLETWTGIPGKRKKTGTGETYPILDYTLQIPPEMHEEIKEFVKENKVTLAALFYTCWGILLQTYNNCSDVIFGTTVSGRSAKVTGIEDIAGLFINTIPFRYTTRPEETLLQILYRQDEALREREPYESAPLVEIKKYSGMETREEMFDTVLVIENYPLERSISEDAEGLPFKVESFSLVERTNYDLAVGVIIAADIKANFIYNSDVLTGKQVEEWARRWFFIIKQILAEPNKLAAHLENLLPEEKQKILYEFNNREEQYPVNETVPRLFTRQVKQNPDRQALVYAGNHLSYHELHRTGGQLADRLNRLGIEPGSLVGLLADRSLEMIIGILGILKSGSGYVPLNPNAPAARNEYILEQCNIKLLLTNLKPGKINRDIMILDLKDPAPGNTPIEREKPAALETGQNQSAHPAYVIFTSGSTGKPKGVAITHGNLSPLLYWGYKHLGLSVAQRTLQNLSYYFDWSTWEIFITLTSGACLYITPERVLLDPAACIKFMQTRGITVLHITPTQFQGIANTAIAAGQLLDTLEYLCLGAEKLSGDMLRRSYEVVKPGSRIFNMYGPTEATIMAAVLEINRNHDRGYQQLSSIPIGMPIANTTLLVLDRNFNLTPISVAGELYIGGDGLAQGYLNSPELTYEKFCLRRRRTFLLILSKSLQKKQTFASSRWLLTGTQLSSSWVGGATPFLRKCSWTSKNFLLDHTATEPAPIGSPRRGAWPPRKSFLYYHSPTHPLTHSPIYRTGDITRWIVDGAIEFLGREDHQVKIRGQRIELGEIENRLLAHPGIKDAVVMAREKNDGDRYLCAYIVVKEETGTREAVEAKTLKEFLSRALPAYMIPAHIITIDQMPLNPNKKIDMKALPEPPGNETGALSAPPRNIIDERLLRIWQDVLKVEKIGINDDFFAIGGHSLKVLDLVNAVQKEFKIKLDFQDVFENPTIAELGHRIAGGKEVQYTTISRQPLREHYPLSYNQKRLWYLYKLEPSSPAFNLSGSITLKERGQEEKICRVLEKLVERHESMRTYFKEVGKEPVQIILPNLHVEPRIVGISQAADEEWEKTRARILKEERSIPFKLEEPPLFRVALIRCGEAEFEMVLTMHHIITDGWSVEVLQHEFLILYNAPRQDGETTLKPLPIRYIDYVYWQNALVADEEKMQGTKTFWENQLKGDHPELQLPYDNLSGNPENKRSAGNRFIIPAEMTETLRKLAGKHKASLFMLLLAGMNVLLSRLTGQEDIILAIPAAARQHDQLKNVIGLFVNTLVLRNRVNPDETFADLLERVQENTLQALENQSYPLELICSELKIKYPRVTVFFNMLAFGDTNRENLQDQRSYTYEEVQEAKFPLVCYLSEYKDGVEINTHYYTELFKPSTIEKIMKKYVKILSNICRDTNQPLN